MFWQSQVSGRLAGTLWKHLYWSLQLNIFGWEKYFNYTAGRGGVMVRWVDMDINNSTGSRGGQFCVKVLFRGVCIGKIFPPDHCIGSAVLRWCWCGGGPSAFTTALHRSGQLQHQTYMKLHNTTNNTTINHVFTLAPPSNIGWRCEHQTISHQVGAAALWWSQGS